MDKILEKKKMQDKATNLEMRFDKKEQQIIDLIVEKQIALSSTQYRLGDIIIKGMKPSRNTLKAPVKIFKLLKEDFIKKRNEKKETLSDKCFSSKKVFNKETAKVAFVVTDAGKNVTAGDYFTAMEFGEAMKKRGWEITFVKRSEKNKWYKISDDVDILISLLETYDVTKIKCNNKNLITIAWARNWFENWVEKSYINKFDYILASSKIGCKYMEKIIGLKIHLLEIATNKERFNKCTQLNNELKCDYCFTGSYWGESREIMNMINPKKYPQYKFNIYGRGWNKINKFFGYNKGFIPYYKMPEIYASTKIVIDDANRVTKPFGSVNSRVFDALASGVLVITNGVLGARYTFDNLLPTYTNEEGLYKLIKYYLDNEEERTKLVDKLQDSILNYHTYDKRVDELIQVLEMREEKKYE